MKLFAAMLFVGLLLLAGVIGFMLASARAPARQPTQINEQTPPGIIGPVPVFV